MFENILQAIGNTPIVRINKLVENPYVAIHAKLEEPDQRLDALEQLQEELARSNDTEDGDGYANGDDAGGCPIARANRLTPFSDWQGGGLATAQLPTLCRVLTQLWLLALLPLFLLECPALFS